MVIGNAAMVENGPFLDIRPDQWQAHLDLNLTGNFHLGQAAARIMVRQEPLAKPGCQRGVRGKILFNGSWVQDMPWPEGCCYGVAKAGLALMARDMAQELAVHGIRVNVLAPGIVMAGLSKICYETDPNFGPRPPPPSPCASSAPPSSAPTPSSSWPATSPITSPASRCWSTAAPACRGGIDAMRLSYVLPDPASYRDWDEFDGDLACLRNAGYDAVELQIADPAQFDQPRVRLAGRGRLRDVRLPDRLDLLQPAQLPLARPTTRCGGGPSPCCGFVDLAAEWKSLIVFGSLQGRLSDEPDRAAGARASARPSRRSGRYATEQGVTLAFEPVNHGEVGFHNTIAEVAAVVREPRSAGPADDGRYLPHEHRREGHARAAGAVFATSSPTSTSRRPIATCWGLAIGPRPPFSAELARIDYRGYCTVGVYNTRRTRRRAWKSAWRN